MTNKLLVLMIAAAAGCGVVTPAGPASGGSADNGDDAGIAPTPDAGSDTGSGSDMGSGSGSGSGSLLPPDVLIGSIQDERNDTVAFTAGKVHHTHTGAAVDLGTGCPAVYKYGYLMDSVPSTFVVEATPNPIAWKVRAGSPNLDTSATAYRVRDALNNVVLDWTHLVADGDGVYHVTLTRNTIAQLATKTGQYHVEVKLHDLDGHDTVPTACFDNHPLAAPLETAPLAPADLMSYSFADHSPISSLFNWAGPSVYQLAITQYADEPVVVTIHAPQTTYTATRVTADAYIKTSNVTTAVRCPNYFDGACAQVAIPTTVYANVYTPNVHTVPAQLVSSLTDEVTHQVICTSSASSTDLIACTLPARAASEAPHPYKLSIGLTSALELAPPFVPGYLGSYMDQLIGSTFFTTAQPAMDALVTCAEVHQSGPLGSPDYHFECWNAAHYEHAHVLKQGTLAFPAYSIQLTSAPTAAATFAAPPHLPPSYLHIDAQTWDSGDSGL